MIEPFTRIVGRDWREQDETAPLCRRLEAAMRGAIAAGRLVAGVPLPSERAMAAGLSVSRITVRQALAPLITEGLIVTRPGSGATVAAKAEPAAPAAGLRRKSALRSHVEELADRGDSVETRLVDRLAGPPSASEAMTLGLGPGGRVLRLYRLHLIDGHPRILELTTLPALAVDAEAAALSPERALSDAGLKPVRGIERFRAVALGATEAGLLDLPEGTPAMRIERVSYTDGGRAVEISRAFCRADGYEVVTELMVE